MNIFQKIIKWFREGTPLPVGYDWGQINFMGLNIIDSKWIQKPDVIWVVGFDEKGFINGKEVKPGDLFTSSGKRWQVLTVERYWDPLDMWQGEARLMDEGEVKE